MVSQETRIQQKTVFWPLIIHPLCCAGRCWFIVAEDGPLCYLDDSLWVKFTRMSIQIAWETPSWNILHIFNYSSTVLSIHKWLECVRCITKKPLWWHSPCCEGICFWTYQQVLVSNLSLKVSYETGIDSPPFFFKFHTRFW
jgi:hypothetical protein